HEKRPSVYAYTGELEQWRETRKTAVESEPAPADDGAELDDEPAPSRPLDPAAKAASRPNQGWQLWPIVVVIAIIFGAGLLAGRYWTHLFAAGPSSVRIQSLAVLPFKNISNDSQQEYFADGITEELISELARTGL